MRRVLIFVAFVVGGCTDTSPDSDASDAGRDVRSEADASDTEPPTFGLLGPDLVFAGQSACFELRPVDSLIQYNWGDESSTDAEGEACHTWEFPGAFLVVARTETTDASKVVQVVLPLAPEPPQRSTAILAETVGERQLVFAVTADDGSLAVIDADELERVARVEVCDTPRTVALVRDEIVVACQSDELAFVQMDTWAVERVPMPSGSRPFAVVRIPGTDELLVSLQDIGEVAVIRGRAIDRRIRVGPDARAISIGADGLALISRWRAARAGATVYALDLGRDEVSEIVLPRQEGLDSDTDNSGVPSFLDTVVFSPDGIRALVPSLKANNVSGSFLTGEPLRDETTARAILSEIVAFGAGDVEQSFRFSFDDLDYASALVATRLGERVYVAFMGAERVLALDAYTFDIAGSIANVGHAPRGLALSQDDSRLFVYADLSREVRVYDVRNLRSEPELLAAISTIDAEPLRELVGKQVFYRASDERMSRTSYLSCASCHLDGEGDNLVWDFTQRGEGLRNTPSLLGTVSGALHWTGNFDEVQDFENDIRVHQSGTGFMSDADFAATQDTLGPAKAGRSAELDGLAAYVLSLRAAEMTSPFDEDTEGADVFRRAGCAGCHGGSEGTDSAVGVRHDVGTQSEGSGRRLGGALDGLDTPVLRGLWRSAPYLHDGSAADLNAVLERAADEHGNTSELSAGELDALLRHLRSLD